MFSRLERGPKLTTKRILRIYRVLPHLACSLLLPAVAAADSSARFDQEVNRIAEEHHLPSFSVAISKGGDIVYSTAVGFADLENEVPATPQTVYPVGSVTKTVTAAAALRLAELGDLDLDAPIQESCPAFPDKGHPISARQLLGHLAGIRHYDYRRFDEDFLNKRNYASFEEALGKFAEDPLVADPGTNYHYSSWGYVVVGCAIEGASGLSYAEAIYRDVLKPAGMKSTRLNVVQDIIPHRARGYSLLDDESWANSGFFDASDRYSAGGLVGTAEDLVRLADALMDGRVLNDQSFKTMTSQQQTSSHEDTDRGLGLEIGEYGAELYHGGTSVGASSFLYIRPEEEVVVALLTNLSLWTKPRHEVARRLARMVAESD